MPVMKKQTPTMNGPPAQARATGLLGTAIQTKKLVEEFLKVTIYGRNRSGKTTLACQFPKPLLLVSAEPEENGGAMSVSKMDGVSLIRVSYDYLFECTRCRFASGRGKRACPACGCPDRTQEELKGTAKAVAIANELQETNPFKTVVFDTVTSLQEMVFAEIMSLPSLPDTMSWGMAGDQTYQQRAEKTRSALRRYMDLGNCNVVFLAQEKDHNPVIGDRGKSKLLWTMQQQSHFAADLGDTNARWLQDGCGYVMQLYEDEVREEISIPITDATGAVIETQKEVVGTGKRGRHLRCLYHPNFAGGFRSPNPEVVPEFFTAKSPREMYEKFIKLTKGVPVEVY